MNLNRSTLIASGVAVLLLVGIAFAYMDSTSAPGANGGATTAAPGSPQPRVLSLLDDLRNGDVEVSDAPVKRSDTKEMPFAVRGKSNSPLGFMQIPAVGLKTKFYSGVVDAVVEKGPGHWPGTPLPGNHGNSVFAGHRTTFTAPFADLDLLTNGDKIKTKVGRNETVTYRVFNTTVVPEVEYVDFVLRQPKKDRARLITVFACTPKGQRTHRIVVQARAIKAPEGQKNA